MIENLTELVANVESLIIAITALVSAISGFFVGHSRGKKKRDAVG